MYPKKTAKKTFEETNARNYEGTFNISKVSSWVELLEFVTHVFN